MIVRKVVEAIRKQGVASPDQLAALLDVAEAADQLTDALGEFDFDARACSEAAERADATLDRLRVWI